jgi:hypothetical protein
MKLRIFAVFVTAIVSTFYTAMSAAQIGGLSGSDLVNRCEQAERILLAPRNAPSGANVSEAYQCSFFMSGVIDGVRAGIALTNSSQRLFCLPRNAANDQILRVVLTWLRQHPQDLHDPAGILVAVALRDAFPC